MIYLSNASYHAHPAISSSDVKAVASKSLAHWKGKVWKDSSAFALGSAVHALVLEPEKNLVLRGPEDRRGDKWKKAQLAAAAVGKNQVIAKILKTNVLVAQGDAQRAEESRK